MIGDVVDAYCLSRFGKSLGIAAQSTIASELRLARKIVADFAAIAPTTWLAGNHEDRFRKRMEELPFLAPYAPDPFAALAKKAGAAYVPRGYLLERQRLICHGEHGGWPVRAEAKARKLGVAVLEGHTHQLRLDWLSSGWYALECGHLVDPRAPVFEYSAGARDGLGAWCPGFSWIGRDGIPRIERL